MQVDTRKTVRELAVELPQATRVFEKLGIDYCCGGKRPLSEACEATGVATETVLAALEDAARDNDVRAGAGRNWAGASMTELIGHIQQQHHAYVRKESPRLQQLFAKVVSKHGENHVELAPTREVFESLIAELSVHMMKEENILFPYIIRMEEAAQQGTPCPPAMFGTVQNPVRMMMNEHDNAGELLKHIRQATNGLRAPDDACTSFRALYQGILEFEADLHQHIHLENNLLFPRALEVEDALKSQR